MVTPFRKTLFVVNSPFQCLCMFEAIKFFNITDYDVQIGNDKFSSPKVKLLLDEKGIDYYQSNFSHLIYDVIPFLFSCHEHYDNIFLGYYYSAADVAASYIYSRFHAQLYFLDDGIQAYTILSDKPRVRYPKLWVKIAMAIYGIIKIVKLLPREKYFTIFDITSKRFEIIHNPFNTFRISDISDKKGVYIIGTNSSVMQFKGHEYKEYLGSLFEYCMAKYPGELVYYCPHRRDENNKEIFSWCKGKGLNIFDTKISVEYDFANLDIYPKAVIGFNSNALYTLKMLFHETEVSTVDFHLENKEREMESILIQTNLQKKGINIINLL